MIEWAKWSSTCLHEYAQAYVVEKYGEWVDGVFERNPLGSHHDVFGTRFDALGNPTSWLSEIVIETHLITRSKKVFSDIEVLFNDGTNQLTYTSSSEGIASSAVTAGSSSRVTASLAYSSSTKAISSQDALDALKLSVGLSTSAGTKTAFDFMSADFNQDGKVSSQDALSILKYSVGLPTSEQAKWVFVDTNGDYSDVSKSNTSYTEGVSIADLSADTSVSLTGILIGDVNDSYSGLIA